MRRLCSEETSRLEAQGNRCADWSRIAVSDDFTVEGIEGCRFAGDVTLGAGVSLTDSYIADYTIADRATVRNVTALECRCESSFGNGVGVAAVNECGGRTVHIFEGMSAQTAYICALYRYRKELFRALDDMALDYASSRRSARGYVGRGARVDGARFVRETYIADGAEVEGATVLCNGTVAAGARVGFDVKAYDFIVAENAVVDNGATLERCFVGESARLDNGFTAVDSLFFANCHCENGEAASIFAGPYTVSHHKSSLLIAGVFSFFNAGSGTNQSNHLFKSGAVHQAVHMRGCKFASNAYVMSPVVNGAFTTVLGRHTHHHDTCDMPYSILLDTEGRSFLLPGANLTSAGTARDIRKWAARDKRKVFRDVINFEEHNPYVAGAVARAIDILESLRAAAPDADTYHYNSMTVKSAMLRRGLKLYRQALAVSLATMLSRGDASAVDAAEGCGAWCDVAGAYVSRAFVERLETLDAHCIDEAFRTFARHYHDYARAWAEDYIASHAIDRERIIAEGEAARAYFERAAATDLAGDCSMEKSISYGIDGTDCQREEDFRTVRNL